MCSGSEVGSHSRLIDFVYHSTLGLGVIKKKRCFPKVEDFLVKIVASQDTKELVTVSNHQVLDLRTTTSLKCAAVPRRARIQGS